MSDSTTLDDDNATPKAAISGSGVPAKERPRRLEEAAAEEAFTEGVDDLPSSGLLSFYDRLRERIVRAVASRGGKLGETTVQAVLLVPDVFVLLLRLLLDRETPGETRSLIGGALAYFVLPIDLLPEAFVGVGGFVDDLVLAAIVLSAVLSPELEDRARRYWSGSDELRSTLGDVVRTADSLLGEDVFGRLKGLLQRRGIELGGSTSKR
jgi:uncharacterized membrane protein YkvA (DUF1232 family)